ncbi:DUF3040 domain-containing protein [Corynebacterium sp. CCM 9185]|uniref:DUF3040 domain-containing protein n=1 Tax=Corynebacterium marambiense TaxID=2765364 RepID=A0ABS0VVP8_9CORY|nr:DUF3040 domain-containing protein [Corynebacterium marambiense]MBI9000869.1 DUF3040 domain-containing protein [Corynebacterium marambiense]MCK7662863.1 DUF3040 domain-containing protein [Corynebacterium marambiense]MCX7542472.1 DUF3040 domain-containing protein [Corynebacterium marambiense]
MSLSEQEQRMFREIEESLMADPKFGAGLGVDGSANSSRPAVSLRGVAVGSVGLLFLIGGIAFSLQSLWFVALSVVGFLIMFGAGVWMLRGGDGEGDLDSGLTGGLGVRSRLGGAEGSGSGFGSRMEERFRKRFEE